METSEVSFRKPSRWPPNRSKDWTVTERRLYGSSWKGCVVFCAWRLREWVRVLIQDCDVVSGGCPSMYSGVTNSKRVEAQDLFLGEAVGESHGDSVVFEGESGHGDSGCQGSAEGRVERCREMQERCA